MADAARDPDSLARPSVAAAPDGRRIAYVDVGHPRGLPVMYFHGLGSSRLARHPDDGIARRIGVRLIAIDRPGIGASDPKPHRRLLDWPDDVAAVADHLGIERFAVLGWSGGAAYALATAHRLPDRVACVGIASGAVPLHGPWVRRMVALNWRLLGLTCRYVPSVAQVVLNHRARRLCAAGAEVGSALLRRLPKEDQAVLRESRLRAMFAAAVSEAFRQGGAGWAADALILGSPWGFEPERIRIPAHVWHGAADPVLPVSFAHETAHALPDARLRVFPNEGHLAFLTHWEEILAALGSGKRATS